MQRVKKILMWIVIAFAVYAVFTSPDRAAELVKTLGAILADGAASIFRFLDALIGG